jgi:hypothetical protein
MEIPIVSDTQTPQSVVIIPTVDKITSTKKQYGFHIAVIGSSLIGDCEFLAVSNSDDIVCQFVDKQTKNLVSWVIMQKTNGFVKSNISYALVKPTANIGDCKIIVVVDNGKDLLCKLVDKTDGTVVCWLIWT